jgi:hypothetical protein
MKKRWWIMIWTNSEWYFPKNEGFESLEEAQKHKEENGFGGIIVGEVE